MLQRLDSELETNSRKFKITETSLLKLIEKKDQEMFKLQSDLTSWKKNSNILEEQIQKSKAESSNGFQLSQEIGLLKQRLEQSEIQRHNLQRVIQDLNEGWAADKQVQIIASENKKLKEEIQSFKNKALKLPNSFDQVPRVQDGSKTHRKEENVDEVESALYSYLHRLKLVGLFTYVQKNTYQCCRRKVHITLKNGILFCRVGGVVTSIDDFLANYCSKEIETILDSRKMHPSSRTPPYSPIKGHKRSSTNSGLTVSNRNDDADTETTGSFCSKSSFDLEKYPRKDASPTKKIMKSTIGSNKGKVLNISPVKENIATREQRTPKRIPFR